MQNKHTPGPWQMEICATRGAWIKNKDGKWAAISAGETDEEAEANGLLIAAAPELLELLKRAETIIRQDGYILADEIQSAIAKATGSVVYNQAEEERHD